jgi:hypothetical protein
MEFLLFVASAALGFIVGILINVLFTYWQFKDSLAGNRVKMVAEGTREIIAKLRSSDSYPGQLRNKYRYSLGVIIDDLSKMRSGGFKDNGKWPLLVDNVDVDHWSRFIRYVRPVVDDINPYSVLAGFRDLRLPLLGELHALINLCWQLEIVVSELDAAFENPSVVELSAGGIAPIKDIDEEMRARVQAVEKAYQ